jgi:hypothetical protein
MIDSNNNFIKHLKQIIASFTAIIVIVVRHFLKPTWILLFICLYLFFSYWLNTLVILSKLTLDEWKLIRDYLEVFLSFPVVILILGISFLTIFREPIKTFLNNSRPSQLGPVGVEQSQTPSPELPEAHGTPATPAQDEEGIINELVRRNELLEFHFLKLALVSHTQLALAWFYYQPEKTAVKNLFLTNFELPAYITNVTVEKEAVLNALVQAGLLEQDLNTLRVTQKGENFLRFINVIP